MEKYYNENGEVGVLYSPGYGAGWSTWAFENSTFLMFDKTLVQMALDGKSDNEVQEYLNSKNIEMYTGGWRDAQVKFMKQGTAFLIDEYDGYESIRYFNGVVPHIA